MLLSDDRADWLLQILEGLVGRLLIELKDAPILQSCLEPLSAVSTRDCLFSKSDLYELP